MPLTILYLIIGLALIIVGANALVDGSSFIARKFGMTEFVVGMVIVGIGTSLPEMVVSFISAFKGHADLSIGNIVGSNIANIFMMLGITAIIAPIPLTKNNLKRDIPFAILASLLLFVLAYDALLFGKDKNILSIYDGIILLLCFILFMYYSFKFSSKQQSADSGNQSAADAHLNKKYGVATAVLKIAAGIAFLVFGGRLCVNSGTAIASAAGIPDAYIGITVMAFGTSLPELAASIAAASKKKGQMALGNIIGSNVANILLILGGSALIHPLALGKITIFDFVVMISACILLIPCAYTFKKHSIDRWEGIIFFTIYVAYVTYLTANL